MRNRFITTAALSIPLLLTACAGSDYVTVVPEDRLDAALLVIDDFDDEWSQEMRGVFTSRDEGPQSFDPSGWCPRALMEIDELSSIEELAGQTGAAVEFRQAREDKRRMFHGVSQQVWSNENVARYFDVLSEAFEICMGETWSPEPDQEVTVTPFDSPQWGDKSLAVDVSIVTPGPDGDYVWSSRLVVVVIESALMVIRDLDVQLAGSELFMSDDDWNAQVEVAVDRFKTVLKASSAKGGFLATEPFFVAVSPVVSIR